jgi:hypothetical protein
MAASQEIARMTGQYQSCQMVLREGPKVNTFISEAGPYLLLLTQVSSEVPLGWARLLIREAGQQVAKIVSTPPEIVPDLKLGGLGEGNLSTSIDDALDSMWMR